MQKTKKTVTIGVSIYNESQNITYLLDSILKQKLVTCSLDKIIIISDGSTDDTINKIEPYLLRYPKISIITDKIRKGKINRLQQIYKMNKSQFIIIFDGDIILGNPFVIENITQHFSDNKVAIVGGHLNPVKPTNFAEKVITAWYDYRESVLKDLNKGNNIHNLHGCAIAIRKDFAKKIIFPKGIISESQYLYCYTIKLNLSIVHDKKAIIYFRVSNSLREYFFKNRRAVNEKQKLKRLFGSWIFDLYRISKYKKIKSFIKMMIINPFFTFLALIFYLFTIIIPKKNSIRAEKALWEIAKSTKIAIREVQF